jgi:hypothetical protein
MKIAVCVPHLGTVKSRFAESLGRLIIHSLTVPAIGPSGRVRPEIELFFGSSSVLPQVRSEIVAKGLGWGAEWLLLVDSDQTFPPDALFRLLAHGKPAIGCNCPARSGVSVIPPGSGVAEVDYLGLAFFLVHRAPFEKIVREAQEAGSDSAFPLFMLGLTPDGKGYVGEDVFFCNRLKDVGFPVFCDHELSREIGHIAEIELRLGKEGESANTARPAAGHQQRR